MKCKGTRSSNIRWQFGPVMVNLGSVPIRKPHSLMAQNTITDFEFFKNSSSIFEMWYGERSIALVSCIGTGKRAIEELLQAGFGNFRHAVLCVLAVVNFCFSAYCNTLTSYHWFRYSSTTNPRYTTLGSPCCMLAAYSEQCWTAARYRLCSLSIITSLLTTVDRTTYHGRPNPPSLFHHSV